MGGYGSTRWGWYSKRWTAEECLKLSIFTLRSLIGEAVFHQQRDYGSLLIWSIGGRISSSIGYKLTWQPPRITLRHTPNKLDHEVTTTITLQSTPCNYGGVRWWFTCPGCGRRVGVLFYRRSFVAGLDWMCRSCKDLTYASAQEAHSLDRGASPYKALISALDKLYKAEEKLEKHHWGRKAEKVWERYMEAAERAKQVAQMEEKGARQRRQKILDALRSAE